MNLHPASSLPAVLLPGPEFYRLPLSERCAIARRCMLLMSECHRRVSLMASAPTVRERIAMAVLREDLFVAFRLWRSQYRRLLRARARGIDPQGMPALANIRLVQS